jgi:solute carrier family 35, member E1
MLDTPQPFPGPDDPRRRLDHGAGSRRALEVKNEKVSWKDGGILPTPALSQRPSWLSSIVSLARHSLSPSSRPRHRHTSVHWKLSEGGLSVPFPSWSTIRFIFLCSLWYMSSAMSSNTGKVIFMQFRFPITLTIIQFGFVAAYSALLCNPVYGMTIFRPPTKAILRSTVPMAAFQVGGHMFSSFAISRIPVSTVHTIKVCWDHLLFHFACLPVGHRLYHPCSP